MEIKRLLQALLATMVMVCTAFAEIKTGSCGTNATYTLDTETGLLKIEGTGAMKDYDYNSTYQCSNSPWDYGKDHISRVEIADGITNIGNYAFFRHSSITSVALSNTTTSIGHHAFSGCCNLTSVKIPNSVTNIGGCAFDECYSLSSVNIPHSVENIGAYAFSYCKSLTSIIIGDSVSYIDLGAFEGCSNLTSVTIGRSVAKMNNSAFGWCTMLTDILSLPIDPPHISGLCFPYISQNAIIKVRTSSIDKYKSAEVWKDMNIVAYESKYNLTYIIDNVEYQTFTYEEGDTITPITCPAKEGNTFSGWSEIPETMPDHDVVVTGSFSPNSYKVTFVCDNKILSEELLPFGSKIVALSVPEKTGYSFKGWLPSLDETVPDHDVYYTAIYEINTYAIKYVIDGEVYLTDSLKYMAPIRKIEAPEKEGYTFSGWGYAPKTMPAHDVTVSGTYNVNQYEVTFVSDGIVVSKTKQNFGSEVVVPEDPTKEGYTFDGWYPEVEKTVPSHDLKYIATFAINSYSLTYVVDGMAYKKYTLEYGAEISTISVPKKEGYTFSGWGEVPETMPSHDVVLYGSYDINQYTVSFIKDGLVIQQSKQDYGSKIVAPDAPAKTGHTFAGWFPEIDDVVPAHDVSYMATYTINSYTLTYVVDGTTVETMTLKYGEQLPTVTIPEKEGYTIMGWSNNYETMPAKDVVMTAIYSVNQYTVTFLDDNLVVSKKKQDYGTKIVAPTDPYKEGYTFCGWYPEVDETVPAHNVTYIATYTINTYTVTYMLDGKVYETSKVKYGETIETPAEPEKEGYTFNGWGEVPSTMPARNLTIYGNFSINQYLVLFYSDGKLIEGTSQDYGSAIVTPNAPSKEGYTFLGWNPDVAKTVPAHNVVYEAIFVPKTYKVYYYYNGKLVHTDNVKCDEDIPAYRYHLGNGIYWTDWLGKETYDTMPAHDIICTANIDDSEDAIGSLHEGDEKDEIYDLNGKKLTQTRKNGIYIINGRKVLVK